MVILTFNLTPLVIVDQLLGIADLGNAIYAGWRLLPHALGVCFGPSLQHLELLQYRNSFLRIVLAASIVTKLEPACGDSRVGQSGSVKQRDYAILAVGSRRYLIKDAELYYFADECTQKVA
jgi:hypothetical protein